MKLFLFDTETSGLEASDPCIEAAGEIFCTKHAAPVETFGSLIRSEKNDAEFVNGIPMSMLAEAPLPEEVWPRIVAMAAKCDVIVAHRAEFDIKFVPPEMQQMKWCCSKFDIDWPKARGKSEHLLHLALAHGVGVVHAHRAMSDVNTLSRLFSRVAEMGSDIDAMIAKATRPKEKFISLAPFEQKDVVKANGFAWDPRAKVWYRSMPPEDVEALPFKVRKCFPPVAPVPVSLVP